MYSALTAKRVVRRRRLARPRRPDWATFKATHLSDPKRFARYLRVTEAVFDRLVEGIRSRSDEEARAQRAGQNSAGKQAGGEGLGGYVPTELRLAMTLRYLAGASYLDLVIIFGVHHATFYAIVWETLKKLDDYLPALSLEDDIQNVQRCRTLSEAFAEPTGHHVRGCIGALDGLALKIESPTGVDNPLKYFCRKLFHSVSVQAVCDAHCRFTYMSVRCAGSVHDSTAWGFGLCRDGATRIGVALAESEVLRTGCEAVAPYGFYLVADDAYRCCQTVVAPWSAAAANSQEDSYNYQHARLRIKIECSFGMLRNKFLILARPLRWSFFKSDVTGEHGVEHASKPALLLRVCMKLHNACVDERMEEELSPYSDFSGGYETAEARAKGAARGFAEMQPTMASGWAHPEEGEVPSWDDEAAAAAAPAPGAEELNTEKKRKTQIERVSKARVRQTDAIGRLGIVRPSASAISANMRAARRYRQSAA